MKVRHFKAPSNLINLRQFLPPAFQQPKKTGALQFASSLDLPRHGPQVVLRLPVCLLSGGVEAVGGGRVGDVPVAAADASAGVVGL